MNFKLILIICVLVIICSSLTFNENHHDKSKNQKVKFRSGDVEDKNHCTTDDAECEV